MTTPFSDHRPLVAILRGVQPDEVVDITGVLLEAGFGIIEVPLNSPEPLKSIARIVDRFEGQAIMGAGTVLTTPQVDAVLATGASLIVSPNMSPDVIRQTKATGGLSFPGVFSPTEAFAALEAGADALKFFPASLYGPEGVRAVKAVLPADVPVLAVGGVSIPTIGDWIAAGTDGFGIGSNVYKAGWDADRVRGEARAFVAAYDAAVIKS